MERLNIAFYTDSYLPAVDGVVTSVLNFRKELERRGHNVYLFASGDAASKKRYSNKKTFIYQGVEFKPYPQYTMAFPFNSALKLRELSVDVVHAQTPFMMGFAAIISARIGKYPMVSTFHTLINNKHVVDAYYPKNENIKRFTKKYLWLYTRVFYRKSTMTIAPTPTVERMLRRYGIRNISVVPNSVDVKRFNPRVSGKLVRERLGLRSDEDMVLYVGRVSKEKRIDIMLKACSKLVKRRRRARFVICGSGPMIEHYKRMARSLGIQKHVDFLGFVDSKALPHIYAAADVLCLPSTFETQGIVSIEAMASGKPVVGANYLALKELIKNGRNGEKFKPGDYTSCANKIEKVLNNPDAYRDNAVETAAEFSVERATDKLLDTYNLVLSRRQAIY